MSVGLLSLCACVWMYSCFYNAVSLICASSLYKSFHVQNFVLFLRELGVHCILRQSFLNHQHNHFMPTSDLTRSEC